MSMRLISPITGSVMVSTGVSNAQGAAEWLRNNQKALNGEQNFAFAA